MTTKSLPAVTMTAVDPLAFQCAFCSNAATVASYLGTNRITTACDNPGHRDRAQWDAQQEAQNEQRNRNVERILAASTNHLPESLCDSLDDQPGVICYRLASNRSGEHTGWLLWVPADPHEVTTKTPAEIRRLWKYAMDRRCVYVLLDRDADVIDDLPTWDW